MTTTTTSSDLAIHGGPPVRTKPFPVRSLIGLEEKAAVVAIMDEAIASGNAFGYNGPYEAQYEKDFVDFMGGGFADGVNSGTNALFVALGALGLDPFSEVIVPPITDPGGVMPVVFVGCVPVVADSDPRTYNTSAEQIEPLINERTRAIIVAHIAGEPADTDPIMDLARRHNLYVIEDCAQSHGATYKGRLTGTTGHLAVFSTMFAKHHCTGGQGGVVYTRDEKLFWQAKRFADRGKPFNMENASGNVVAGLNCNLNELSAAIGSAQLRKLSRIVHHRQVVGETIKDRLARHDGAVSLGWQVPESKSSYWFLRLKLDLDKIRVDKAGFCKALEGEGLSVSPSYRNIPAESPWFKNKAVFGKSGYPWASPAYTGPREPHFQLKNILQVVESHFGLYINEAFGAQEIDDILTAIAKVEHAYLK